MSRTTKKQVADGYYRTGLYNRFKPDLTNLPKIHVEPTPYYKILPTLTPELRIALIEAVLLQEQRKKAEAEQNN